MRLSFNENFTEKSTIADLMNNAWNPLMETQTRNAC